MDGEPKRIDVISMMASLTDHTVSRLIDLAYTAQEEGSSQLHLYISSLGGRMHLGFTTYNFFRALDIPVYTYNVGTIEGAALMLYLASDKRAAAPSSKFALSSFEWTFYRNTMYYPEIIEAYESLTHDVKCYTDIFKERTNGSFDIMASLRGLAKILDTSAALSVGLVTDTHIAPPAVPELAKLWPIHD